MRIRITFLRKERRLFPFSFCLFNSRSGGAFTLVELLLAVAVVLLLVGAVVFSFSSLMGGSQLEEGADRVETLIRLARAEASNTGRKVRLVFREEVNADDWEATASIAVEWEPEPLKKPGFFEARKDASWRVEDLNEMVAIDSTKLVSEDTLFAGPDSMSGDSKMDEPPSWLAPITFYPDGSSDTVEIRLVSRDSDDTRRIKISLEGITGSIRREILGVPEQQVTQAETLAP